MTPLVSIVLTSYDAERLAYILALLDDVRRQTYPNIETIFVVEKSPLLFDEINKYLETTNVPNVVVVFNPLQKGASFARNLGIEKARGDILAMIDDDVVLLPNWAEEMVKTYEDDSVIGVTGAILPLWEDESMDWIPEEFDWIFSCARWLGKTKKQVRNVNGPNSSFRREAFDLAGPYNVGFGPSKASNVSEWSSLGEEAELSLRVCMKTGKRIVYNPEMKVFHRVGRKKLSWNFIVQRSYQVGRTRRVVSRFFGMLAEEKNVLTTEQDLLKRIIARVFPQIAREAINRPAIAWRKLTITVVSTLFVFLGYCSGTKSESLKQRNSYPRALKQELLNHCHLVNPKMVFD